jgi:hypothetical protein
MAHTTPSADRWVGRATGLLKRGFWAAAGGSQSVSRRSRNSDRRGERRLKANFLAQISGESGSCRVRGLDISSNGALLLATRPFATQSVVFFHSKSLGLMGFAQIRHCSERRGVNGYAIGVEFPSPLMRDEMGIWQFNRVHPTEGGWSVELEASMNLGAPVRAA